MEPSREAAAAVFALVIVLYYLIISVTTANPLLHLDVASLDNKIAINIDTMASLEQGTLKIPVTAGSVKSVKISFETKGKKEYYKIDEDGWYVIVSYGSPKSVKSASRINTYPSNAGKETTLLYPDEICIYKRSGLKYAEVGRC